MSSDFVPPDLQLIQDWIDQHPSQGSDQLLNHNDAFDFDQFCETQSWNELQQASDYPQTWDNDPFQADLCYQPITFDGGFESLASDYVAGVTPHDTLGRDAYDVGDLSRQVLGYDHRDPTWIPSPKDVVASIEKHSAPDTDGPQGIQQFDRDIASRMVAMETELKSALEQLTMVKDDLKSLHRWAGHMSYVVNEMQLCQRGFSPIIKTFGILLPHSLRPPQDGHEAGDTST